MKKRFIIIIVLVLSYFLVGCQLFNPNRNEPQYKIYEMAKEVGFEGTYEEWLQTIRGIDGTSIKKVELDKDNNLIITLSNGEVINVGNVKGDKGDEIELSVIDGYIKWHYKGSNEWYNLIEVNTLIGEKGDKGDEVEISVIEGYIKWHYKDSEEWYNLIEVSTLIGLQGPKGEDGVSIVKTELDKDNNLIITLSNGEVINVGNVKGDKGDEIELSVVDGYIKWHYKGSNEWYNLIEVNTLIGEKGDKGDEVEISVSEGYIKWHCKDSDEWYNLIEVSTLIGLQGPKGEDGVSIVKTELDKDNNLIITLSSGKVINVGNVKGDKGDEIELSVIDGYIKWHYKGSNEWYDLIEVNTLIGEKGDKGDEVEISVSEGYIKWHYKDSDEWYNLIEVSTLIGDKGDTGNTGKSAYEIYKEKHPEYTKTEEEWLDDLVNGRLATKEVYTVKFITNTEEVIEDQTVEENKKVVKPKNPEKTGYTFIGWFNEYDEQWVFGGYNVTSNVTLYAKYKANTYKITLDNETIIEVEYDSSFTLPVVEKEGYRFKYFEYEGEEFKDTVYKFDKDINITSIYGPLFTLSFDTDGGEDLESIEYHTANIETLPTPVKDGCVFLGWYYNEEVFNVPFNNESLNDITLKAHYRSTVGDYEVEELENNEIKILKYKGTDKEVTIPNKINDKVVTILGESCFKDNTQVEKVILSKDIKEVGNNVFNGCTSLKEVIFNSGISTYKDNILLNCNSLESITIDVLNQSLIGFFNYEESNIPSTFTSINYLSKDKASNASKMFNSITSHLFSINIPNNWGYISSCYFENNTSIKNVNIEDGITSIGGAVFRSCISLQSITLPDTLISIEDYAFSSCTSLQAITLPDTLISIVYGAFSDCSSLQAIILPNNITSIGGAVFRSCTSLTIITLPDSITSIGDSAFSSCHSLQTITLPDNITSIVSSAFNNCYSLTDVFYEGSKSDFINKITIGSNNTSLTNATIHYNSNVTLEYVSTDKYSYVLTSNNEICSLGCNDKKIKSVNLSEEFKDYTIYSLGYTAFYNCQSLKSITLPKTITKIGDTTFSNCSSLTDVFYEGSKSDFINNISIGTNNEDLTSANIHYNSNVTLEYIETENYSYVLTSNNEIYSLICNDKTIEMVVLGEEFKGYTILSLDCRAFYNCESLKSITLPNTITSIGYSAFSYCASLKDVYYDGTEEEFSKITIGEYNNYFTNATIHYTNAETNE